MREVLVILVALVAAAAVEGLFHLARYLSERRAADLRRRLRLLDSGESGGSLGLLRRDRYAANPLLDPLVRALPFAAALERLLAQADSSLTVARLLAGCLAAAVLGFGVPLILGAGALPSVLFGALSAAVPVLGAVVAREQRAERLSEQLPEALDMMSRSLKAGHALPEAFRLVASEMPTPVSVEFGRAYEEQRLGLAAEQAVVSMTARTPGCRDLKIFAVSVLVQKETGGNLAEILENIASTVRDRYRFYAKLKALTAEGRASGMVLGCLPIGMMGLLSVINPRYVSRLFDNPIGQLILAYAVLSWVAGGLWMYRMSKVDF
ncbi:MAG TPA: type II secretion system F family protein [Myxococcales bacterium]|jgi:tight adherence protein B